MNTKLTIASLALAASCQAQVHLSLSTWLDNPNLYGGSATLTLDGITRNVLAGQVLATGPEVSFVGYCTDLSNTLSAGWFTPMDVSVALGSGSTNPQWVEGGIERSSWAARTFGPLVDSDAKAAGLQLAVWELLYDSQPSGNSGRLQFAHPFTSTILSQVPDSPVADGTWWMPSNGSGLYRVGQGLVDVPEPSTWAAGIAFALVSIYRHIRKP